MGDNTLISVSYIVLWALVLLEGLTILAMLRQVGVLLNRLGPRAPLQSLDGPAIGAEVELKYLETAAGGSVAIFAPAALTVLAFMSSGCGICRDLIPGLRGLIGRSGTDELRMLPILVDDLSLGAAVTVCQELGLPGESTALGVELHKEFDVGATPFFIVLDDTGTVLQKGIPNSLEEVENLIQNAIASRVEPSGEPIDERGALSDLTA